MIALFACLVTGHHYRVRGSPERVFLECYDCGHRSRGLRLSEPPAFKGGWSPIVGRPSSLSNGVEDDLQRLEDQLRSHVATPKRLAWTGRGKRRKVTRASDITFQQGNSLRLRE